NPLRLRAFPFVLPRKDGDFGTFCSISSVRFFRVWAGVWVKLNHEVKDGRILDRGKLDVPIPPEVLYQDCRFPFTTALSLSHAIINKAKQFCPSAAPPGTN